MPARLELRLAEPHDSDLAGGIDVHEPRPGRDRSLVVAPACGRFGQCLERSRFARQAPERAIEGGGRRRAVPVAPLSFAKGGGKADLGGEPAHQILRHRDRLLVAAEPIEESQQAVAESGVARRERLGLLGSRQRAVQIAELLADLAEQIPFDRARRLGERVGERPQRAARPCHLAGAGPGGAATLRRAARDLLQERAQALGGPCGVRGVAIGEAQACRSKNERQLRERMMGRNASLEDGGRLGRSTSQRERVGQLRGGAIAVGRETRELAAEPDDPREIGAGGDAGTDAGRAAGRDVGKQSQLRFDQAPSRRRPGLVRDRRFIGRHRLGRSGQRQRPRATRQRRRRIGRQAQRLAEGRRRRRCLSQRQEQLRVHSDRPVARRRRGPTVKALAQPGRLSASRDLDQPTRQRLVVRAIAQGLLGAIDEGARTVAMNLPVGARRPTADRRREEDARECQPTSHPSKVARIPKKTASGAAPLPRRRPTEEKEKAKRSG